MVFSFSFFFLFFFFFLHSGLLVLLIPSKTSDLYNALLRAWNDDTYTSHGALNHVRHSTACLSNSPLRDLASLSSLFSFFPPSPRPEPAVVPNPSPVPCVDALTFCLSAALSRQGCGGGAACIIASTSQVPLHGPTSSRKLGWRLWRWLKPSNRCRPQVKPRLLKADTPSTTLIRPSPTRGLSHLCLIAPMPCLFKR